MASGGKGAIVLAIFGLILGAGGLGFGAYTYFIFTEQLESLDRQVGNLEDDLDEIPTTNTTIVNNITNVTNIESESGKILQIIKVQTDSNAQIASSQTTPIQMTGMKIDITKSNDSYLFIRFFSMLYMEMYAGLTRCHFNVSLELDGVCVMYNLPTGYSEPAVVDTEGFSIGIYLEHITETLPAGTHTITVMWYCEYAGGGSVSLAASNSGVPTERTLIVQEIAS